MSFKVKYYIRNFSLIIGFIVFVNWLGGLIPFPDYIDDEQHRTRLFDDYCFLHILYVFICTVLTIVFIAWTCLATSDADDDNDYMSLYNKFQLPKIKIYTWVILAILILGLIKFSLRIAEVYNTSMVYQKAYEQKSAERQGFYDKMWKTYKMKFDIGNINKDIFIEVSRLIMENKKDSPQLMFKLLHENLSNIDYSEFSKFYTDLSNFVESQREAYFQLEVQCNIIGANQNLLIDTFPNNVYSKLVGIKHIKYEYGFLSDSTNKVFSTKKENL